MTTTKRYAVLGAGMQGTAAAYDLARFSQSSPIIVADLKLEQAQASCNKINTMIGSAICVPASVDATDMVAVRRFLHDVDVLVSAVPYHMQPLIHRVAIDSGTSMVDMGNDTIDTLAVIKRDAEAKEKGIVIVPDTGLAPGLVNSLACSFMEQLDSTD